MNKVLSRATLLTHTTGYIRFKILLGLYIILVFLDSTTTYIGIKHFGFVEMWQSRTLLDYYGLGIGVIITVAFCLSVGWLLWFLVKKKYCKWAAYSGLILLTVVKLVAVFNNSILIIMR